MKFEEIEAKAVEFWDEHKSTILWCGYYAVCGLVGYKVGQACVRKCYNAGYNDAFMDCEKLLPEENISSKVMQALVNKK